MSKTTGSQSTRVSKKEQRRQQIAQEKRKRNIQIAVPIALVALAVIAFALIRSNEPEVDGVTEISSAPGNQHDDTLEIGFGGLPPMGGPHASVWQNCGIYDQPVLPVNAIHSMEHGAVWVSYHPELETAVVDQLQNIVRGKGGLLLSPYPDQDSPIVLTAWDRQLVVDSIADERIEQFIDRYANRRGPETGSPCSGGIGTPLS